MCFGAETVSSPAVEREVTEQAAERVAPSVRVFLNNEERLGVTERYVLVSFEQPDGTFKRVYVYSDGTSRKSHSTIDSRELATFPWYTELTPD